jgi:hypothetical protein
MLAFLRSIVILAAAALGGWGSYLLLEAKLGMTLDLQHVGAGVLVVAIACVIGAVLASSLANILLPPADRRY